MLVLAVVIDCIIGSSGETRGKEASGETQTQMGGQY